MLYRYSCAIFLFLCIYSCDAFACSRSYSAPEDRYKGALAVFEGEVVGTEATQSRALMKVRLRVRNTYKGVLTDEVQLLTGSGASSCDQDFREGQKYFIFSGGDYPGEPRIGLAYLLSDINGYDDLRQMFEVKQRQLKAIDDAIAARPENRDVLMRTRAEHLLFMHDDQQAELVLRDLLKVNEKDDWAAEELMGVLYRLQKVRDILALDQISQGKQGKLAISLATLVSGREAPRNLKIKIEDIKIKNLDREKLKYELPEFKNVELINSNFSGSEFLSARISDSAFVSDNFSKMLFGRAEISNSYFRAVNFTGADLVGASILNSQLIYVNMKDALLSGVKLDGTSYDCNTIWPDGFDPKAAGAKPMNECH